MPQRKICLSWKLRSTHNFYCRCSDSLRAGRSMDRILVGLRFSAPIQTSPGAHPASYTMGTRSFPGAKWPGHGVDHPPPSSAEVEGRVELHLYSPSGPSWPVIGRTLSLPYNFWRILIFWDMSCSMVEIYCCVGRICCLPLQGRRINSSAWTHFLED